MDLRTQIHVAATVGTDAAPRSVAENTTHATGARRRTPRIPFGRGRLAVILICALGGPFGAALLPAAAAAAANGKITGTVKEGATPIEHVRVCAFGPEGKTCALTNAAGAYEIEGVPGKYSVEFTGELCPTTKECGQREYITQFYPGASLPAGSEPVDVTSGSTTSGIDASLVRGGKISGVVTKAPGGTEKLPALVCVFPARIKNLEELLNEALKGNIFLYCHGYGTGEYTIGGLAPGQYKVSFEACKTSECTESDDETYAPQFYNNSEFAETATPVTVQGTETTHEINAELGEALPVNTVAPALTGAPSVGSTLSCSAGEWKGTVAKPLEYAWLRDGSVIAGQTSASYTVRREDEGHTLRCRVTATNNTGGFEFEDSNAVMIAVATPPTPPPPPPTPSTTTTTTSTTSTPAPGTAKVSAAVLKGSKVTITVGCAGAGACDGSVKLSTRVTERSIVSRHGKRHAVSRARSVTIAETGFAIAAGGSETITLTLSAKGRALLHKAGKKGLKVTLSGSDIQGGTLVLKEPAKRGGHKQ
jgi:hypothetical protein